MTQPLPKQVHVVEVGPRDGLQNERAVLSTKVKTAFIDRLARTGLSQIEATSFVHPRAVPQLADAEEVARQLPRGLGVTYSALVPNERGLARAAESGIRRIAVFTGATERFTQNNINMSIAESLNVFAALVRQACVAGITVRGYLSVCFVCPYEGRVAKERVLELTQRLLDLGVNQVAISDTLGAAAPTDVLDTVGHVLRAVPADLLALHFHDTSGRALANVFAGLQLGIETYDSSAGGLGGCPYAPGAAGNLATEDLVSMLDQMDVETGVDVQGVAEASSILSEALGRPLPGREWNRLRAGLLS